MKFFFEENENKPGIYKILNTHTNRVYIGQTIRTFKKRWGEHVFELKNNIPAHKFLLNDYNKCFKELGHDNFLEFHIVYKFNNTSTEELNNFEEGTIALYWGINCYNTIKEINGSERSCYSLTPEESSRMHSEVMKRMWEDPEIRKSFIEFRKEKWNSPEGKLEASQRSQKFWSNEDNKIKMSERIKKRLQNLEIKNKLIAQLNTPEAKEKFSETMKERYKTDPEFKQKMKEITSKNISIRNSTQPVKIYGSLISPEGIVYENISHVPTFAKQHNLYKQSVYSLLLNKETKSCKGWRRYPLEPKEKTVKSSTPEKRKEFYLIHAAGREFKGNNVTKFARENNISFKSIYRVIQGKQKQTCGWRLKK